MLSGRPVYIACFCGAAGSERLKGGVNVADHVKRAVAEHHAVLSGVLDGKPDAVRHNVTCCDRLSELAEIISQLLGRQRAGVGGGEW